MQRVKKKFAVVPKFNEDIFLIATLKIPIKIFLATAIAFLKLSTIHFSC
jgi:hypothetical protein